MNRKKILQIFLDTQLKDQIQEIFGSSSYIGVNNLSYVKSKDSYLINVTLYVNDLDDFEILYPTTVISFIKMAWSVVGHKKDLIIQSSFDCVQQ
jgi:hypothetical protein